jgi:hypothetical protein
MKTLDEQVEQNGCKVSELLLSRLQVAIAEKAIEEETWNTNEDSLFTYGTVESGNPEDDQMSVQDRIALATNGSFSLAGGGDQAQISTTVCNYLIRNHRFLHSQLLTNPPIATARPQNSDIQNKRKAEQARHVMEYAAYFYNLPNKFAQAASYVLATGNAWMKVVYNREKGEVLSYDEETEEILLEGDIDITVPSVRRIYPWPACSDRDDIKAIFEEFILTEDEFCQEFPALVGTPTYDAILNNTKDGGKGEAGVKEIHVFQYWETGLKSNKYKGRFCWMDSSGLLLSEIQDSPHRPVKVDKQTGKKFKGKAELPYFLWTDIDKLGTYWGTSTLTFTAPIQELVNRLDTSANMVAETTMFPTLVTSDSSKVTQQGGYSSDKLKVVQVADNQHATFRNAELPASFSTWRQQLLQAILEIDGLNENAFGQQSRETSGAVMQMAVQQSTATRKRLFDKYVDLVRWLYSTILWLAKDNWSGDRVIQVNGQENAFYVDTFKNMDISSGWDILVEYGSSLPLDPFSRRDYIVGLLPLFEKLNIDPRVLAKMVNLGDLFELNQIIDQSAKRSEEEILEIVVSNKEVPVRLYEDHESRLKHLLNYVESAEFKRLPVESKRLIEKHIDNRVKMNKLMKDRITQLSGDGAAPVAPAAPAQPGQPGLPPAQGV